MGVNIAPTRRRRSRSARRTPASAARSTSSRSGFVSPESFTLTLSIAFLAAVVVGGLATVSGAVLGALFIVLVPEYAADVDKALAGVIYGRVLIAVMYVERGGLVGIARRFGRAVVRTDNDRKGEGAHAEVTGDADARAAGRGARVRRRLRTR